MDPAVQEFCLITGASPDIARRLLSKAQGNLSDAIDAFFSEPPAQAEAPSREPAAARAEGASPSSGHVSSFVDELLSKAKPATREEIDREGAAGAVQWKPFQGQGRSITDDPPSRSDPPPPPCKT
jgi:hypothetical protein